MYIGIIKVDIMAENCYIALVPKKVVTFPFPKLCFSRSEQKLESHYSKQNVLKLQVMVSLLENFHNQNIVSQ